jgi:hypothetical protein
VRGADLRQYVNEGKAVIANDTRRSSGYSVHLGDPRDLPITVERSPYVTLLQRLLDAARGRPETRTRPHPIARSLSSVSTTAMDTLRSSVAVRRLPDVVAPVTPATSVTVAEELQRLGDMSAAQIAGGLESFWGEDMPTTWRRAHERPSEWANSMRVACRDAWQVTRPRWEAADAALDREARRIGLAVVAGGLDAVLNSIHPRLRFANGTLSLVHNFEQVFSRAGRRLVLVPMLASPERIIVNFELPDLVYIAYPLRRKAPQTQQQSDALELVLGPVRASALRVLTHPMTMTELARRLHCAPSTATYHCNSLEASGLLVRDRQGSVIWTMRTARAEHLIDLLSA